MKILLINGSPHENGCTARALKEVASSLNAENIETEMITVGNKTKSGCLDCGSCKKTGKCIIDDIVNEVSAKMDSCDGIVIGSPVYFASANGSLVSFLDRLFFSCPQHRFNLKVGASIASARRAGTIATFDELNKYFFIRNMVVVGSSYWNEVHGKNPEEVEKDIEGLQIMRQLGKNMAWVLKSIQNSGLDKPVIEAKISTNFIR